MKKIKALRFGMVAALSLAFVASSSAGTVTGVVHNGTTGKTAAGVDVMLIDLQGGMQVVANTKSDSEGRYHFDYPAIGQGPMLLRAVYEGVNFHQPLTPGHDTVDLTVYEKSKNPLARIVTSRLIVLQPNGNSLLVGEEYTIENQSQPPSAFYDEQGDFEFQVPNGADMNQVSAWGPSGMPIVQGTIDKGKNRYAIAYAFQPGENGIRISYQIPYGSNSANLQLASPYDAQRVLIAAPPTVQVSSAGFQPSGSDQGYSVYSHEQVAANAAVQIAVSGTAPPPSDESNAGNGGGGAADQVNGRDSGASVQVLPTRLDSLKWILICGFAALFALGLVYLWRKPVAVVAAGTGGVDFAVAPTARPSAPTGGAKPRQESAIEAPSAIAAAPNAPAATSAEQVNREVGQSLDALKDNLFKLELRRQAGTISEEEYARERARTEKFLRDLLRG
ncbi:MAG: hypothetical protein ACLP1Y_11740 [Candidatus Acidiferrales bacterium]